MRKINDVHGMRICDQCDKVFKKNKLYGGNGRGDILFCVECYEGVLDKEFNQKIAERYFHNRYGLL